MVISIAPDIHHITHQFIIHSGAGGGGGQQNAFRPKNEQEFQKLEVDLKTVFEKVKLCREILRESPGIQEDEALAEVIGFLEACRDRMADVIEAGTQGLLNEELLAKCFRANDAIFRTLDAEKVLIYHNCRGDERSAAQTDISHLTPDLILQMV